jgi:hypothetical protein
MEGFESGQKLIFKICKSMAIQVVFEFVTQQERIKMQALNRRFYYLFCPSIVKDVILFELGNVSCGVLVFPE